MRNLSTLIKIGFTPVALTVVTGMLIVHWVLESILEEEEIEKVWVPFEDVALDNVELVRN